MFCISWQPDHVLPCLSWALGTQALPQKNSWSNQRDIKNWLASICQLDENEKGLPDGGNSQIQGVYPFSECLLNAYAMPGTGLGTGDAGMNKFHGHPALPELSVLWERGILNNHTNDSNT